MKKLLFAISLLFVTIAVAHAAPLSLVDAGLPAWNCLFDSDCTISPTDTISDFPAGSDLANGFLQSRLFPSGEAGTPGEGLYAYLYRIDLRDVVGITFIPCLTSFSLDFGPVVPLDYNGDGTLDQAFVISAGGVGNIKPISVDKTGNRVTFEFGSPGAICGGSFSGDGDSSFFFGLASPFPPRTVSARLQGPLGIDETLDTRAPAFVAGPHLGVVPETGPAGLTVRLIGSGYEPGGYDGTLRWDGADVDTFAIPAGGAFAIDFHIPTIAAPGPHTITACSGVPCFTFEFEQIADAIYTITTEPPICGGTFYPTADSTVDRSVPGTNYGSLTVLQAGRHPGCAGEACYQDALLQFDLSTIPAAAIIDEAKLRLNLIQWVGPAPYNLILNNLADPWDEASVTWSSHPGLDTNYGMPSLTPTAVAPVVFDATAMVADWVNGTHANNGLGLGTPRDTGTDLYAVYFSSRERSDIAEWPQLIITCHMPMSSRVHLPLIIR